MRDDFNDEEKENDENPSSQKRRPNSGDDLGDSFVLDEEPKAKRGWVDEVLESGDGDEQSDSDGVSSEGDEDDKDDTSEEGSDDNDLAREKGLSIKDWEQSEDEEDDDEHEADTPKAKEIRAVETAERRKDSSNTKKKNADS